MVEKVIPCGLVFCTNLSLTYCPLTFIYYSWCASIGWYGGTGLRRTFCASRTEALAFSPPPPHAHILPLDPLSQVHIYRLVCENTIEENILRKSDQKRQLDFLAIQSGGFTTDNVLSKINIGDLLGGVGALAASSAPSGSAAAAGPSAEDIKVGGCWVRE